MIFITLFRYFTIVLFFTLHFFSFSQGMQTRERAHCARSVFPFIKKINKITVKGKPKPSVNLTVTVCLSVCLSVCLFPFPWSENGRYLKFLLKNTYSLKIHIP